MESTSAEVTTSFGALKLAGPNALFILLFITQLAIGGLIVWEFIQMNQAIDKILCANKLQIYMSRVEKEAPIDWAAMPVDLYGCIPSFLYERKR